MVRHLERLCSFTVGVNSTRFVDHADVHRDVRGHECIHTHAMDRDLDVAMEDCHLSDLQLASAVSAVQAA